MPPTNREVSRLLSGYLCGTHSAAIRSGRWSRTAAQAASAFRAAGALTQGSPCELGSQRWETAVEERPLAESLRRVLDQPGVIDLILFGSQARGGRTGFSDVDAVLVLSDEAAASVDQLDSLRPHVLAAQRLVVAYQPMQHHGFEVATPRLLSAGSATLGLPSTALAQTFSLFGRGASANLTIGRSDSRAALGAVARQLTSLAQWPRHRWEVHRTVSMFELLPALFVQSLGIDVPKWRSFDAARAELPVRAWPYDALLDVRASWPRERAPLVQRAALVLRNPWVAIAAWRRMRAPVHAALARLLIRELLNDLKQTAHAMIDLVPA